jgi:hypothetical protein
VIRAPINREGIHEIILRMVVWKSAKLIPFISGQRSVIMWLEKLPAIYPLLPRP